MAWNASAAGPAPLTKSTQVKCLQEFHHLQTAQRVVTVLLRIVTLSSLLPDIAAVLILNLSLERKQSYQLCAQIMFRRVLKYRCPILISNLKPNQKQLVLFIVVTTFTIDMYLVNYRIHRESGEVILPYTFSWNDVSSYKVAITPYRLIKSWILRI